MSSSATIYRKNHPEYYERERVKDNERVKKLFQDNTEYREKVKKQALDRYYRLKQEKINASIPKK